MHLERNRTMKKTIACLLIALLFCTMSPLASAESEPSFVVSSASAKPGEEVSITVSLAENPGLASFEYSVVYDKNVLEWTGVTKGNLPGNWDVAVGEAITWIYTDNQMYNGVVTTLTFKVKENATAQTSTVSIEYDPDNVFDENAENVAFAIAPGSVVIQNDEPEAITGRVYSLGGKLSDAIDFQFNISDVTGTDAPQFRVSIGDRVLSQANSEDAYAKSNVAVYSVEWDGNKISQGVGAWVIRIKLFPKFISSDFKLELLDGSGEPQLLQGYKYTKKDGSGVIGNAEFLTAQEYSFLDYLEVMSDYNGGKYTDLLQAMSMYGNVMENWE